MLECITNVHTSIKFFQISQIVSIYAPFTLTLLKDRKKKETSHHPWGMPASEPSSSGVF